MDITAIVRLQAYCLSNLQQNKKVVDMFHALQVDFQSNMHGVCPFADSDPRMRQPMQPENLDLVASGNMPDVLYLDHDRYKRQQNVAAYHRLMTVSVEFDDTLEGLVQKKHFEVGCEAGNGTAPVEYKFQLRTGENGIVHRAEMHWDNDTPARLQAKGRERIVARRELYPHRDDETRLQRVTAHLLMLDGLGHVEKFPTGTRYFYDAYIAQLERNGCDYIRFTDGLHPCVMTGPVFFNQDMSSDVTEIELPADPNVAVMRAA